MVDEEKNKILNFDEVTKWADDHEKNKRKEADGSGWKSMIILFIVIIIVILLIYMFLSRRNKNKAVTAPVVNTANTTNTQPVTEIVSNENLTSQKSIPVTKEEIKHKSSIPSFNVAKEKSSSKSKSKPKHTTQKDNYPRNKPSEVKNINPTSIEW